MLNCEATPQLLALNAVAETAINDSPFLHLVVKNFVPAGSQDELREQFPFVRRGGSIPLPLGSGGRPLFIQLIEELKSPEFRALVEQKLGVSLDRTYFEITTRSNTRPGDGYIHPDSTSKVVSGLIYLEKEWPHGSNGALRILRSSDNKKDFATEVTPTDGTLLLFKRSDTSYHGYEDHFEAPLTERRVIQFNWYKSAPVKTAFRTVRLALKRIEAALTNLFER